MLRLIAVAALVALSALPAQARPHSLPSGEMVTCDDRTCHQNATPHQRPTVAAHGRLHQWAPRQRPYRMDTPAATGGGYAKVCSSSGRCAPVAASAAAQFQALFEDFEALGFNIGAPGCLAARSNNYSLHPRALACDIFGQRARNVMDLPHPSPSEQIAVAARHGLISGCEWRNPDCGHFQVGGSYARVAHHHRIAKR